MTRGGRRSQVIASSSTSGEDETPPLVAMKVKAKRKSIRHIVSSSEGEHSGDDMVFEESGQEYFDIVDQEAEAVNSEQEEGEKFEFEEDFDDSSEVDAEEEISRKSTLKKRSKVSKVIVVTPRMTARQKKLQRQQQVRHEDDEDSDVLGGEEEEEELPNIFPVSK